MAEVIFYKVETPADGVEVPWTGCKPSTKNTEFDGGEYDRVFMLEDTTECLRDASGNAAGILQQPLKFWKEVNINTPHFKEVCHRRLLTPKMTFHLFHTLKGDTAPVNFLTIEYEEILILQSKVILFDTSGEHDPGKGVINQNKSKPYIEEVILSAQKVTWKYKRDSDPLSADHGSQFIVT